MLCVSFGRYPCHRKGACRRHACARHPHRKHPVSNPSAGSRRPSRPATVGAAPDHGAGTPEYLSQGTAICTVSIAAMTSHVHNLVVCIFTLVGEYLQGGSQEAGVSQVVSQVLPTSLQTVTICAPTSDMERARFPRASPTRSHCMSASESGEKQYSIVLSSSIPPDRSNSRSFFMFESRYCIFL